MFNPLSMLNQAEIIKSGAYLEGKVEKYKTSSPLPLKGG